jgi:hypothetical protein
MFKYLAIALCFNGIAKYTPCEIRHLRNADFLGAEFTFSQILAELAFFADILAEFAILGNVGMLMILT